ncbi:MAG: hypothetical protein ACI8XC_001040, partial [Gammaproteobacteria bacterium]
DWALLLAHSDNSFQVTRAVNEIQDRYSFIRFAKVLQCINWFYA